MAKTLYEFKTGVLDFLGQQGATSPDTVPAGTPFDWNFVSRNGSAGASYVYPTGESTFVNVRNAFLTTYSDDPLLNNDQVKSIGYGWQKWTVPRNMTAEIMVRGGCGGHCAATNAVLNQTTGLYSGGNGYRGGRGAKLIGNVQLSKGDVLYILVGFRGWCNVWTNYIGSFGGGASCVFKENPQGQYTFEPTNKKVDVLFVAGAGGGASDSDNPSNISNGERFMGKDALYTNGTNTNGGLVSTKHVHSAGPGAGLTGNGFTTPATGYLQDTLINYNLLSGRPVSTMGTRATYTTRGNGVLWGTWGGGGGAINGGGGGAGYSGGDAPDMDVAISNSSGGYGGTSYINPQYVTEIFRGYETNASMNPFSIPGSVQIFGGRDESEWFLAEDEEGFKRWEESLHRWVLLPNQTPPTAQDFETYGVANPIGGFSGLIIGDVNILCSSPYPTKDLTISGYINKQLVKCNFEMSTVQVDVFRSWNLNNLHNSVIIKVAISVDHGLTYKMLASNIWTNIDINNRELFYAQGILLQDLNTIPNVKWKELGATNLRFAFIVHQTASFNNPVLTSIDLVADLLGSWRKAIHGTNYDYEYIAPDTCKITINTAGDYKINYLDQVDE